MLALAASAASFRRLRSDELMSFLEGKIRSWRCASAAVAFAVSSAASSSLVFWRFIDIGGREGDGALRFVPTDLF